MKDYKSEKLFNSRVAMFEVSSKSLGFHNIPFFANSTREAVNVIRSSVVGGRDGYLRHNLDDLCLNCIGFYDTDTGIIDTSKCPFVVVELADIPNIKEKEGDKV